MIVEITAFLVLKTALPKKSTSYSKNCSSPNDKFIRQIEPAAIRSNS